MDWEWLRKNWRLVMAAKWVILPLVAIAAGSGWWFADYHYSGRIEALKEALNAKGDAPPAVWPPVGTVGGTGNAVSVGQQRGVTAGTVNVLGPQDRVLNDAAKAKVLSMLPNGAKKISIMSVGNDYEGAKFAQTLAGFLNSKGYDAIVAGVGMYGGAPPVGVIISDKIGADGVERITVGVNHAP